MRYAERRASVCGLVLWTLLLCAPAFAADAPAGCVPAARIVSIQGSVQIQRSGQAAWTVVRKLDTVLCQRDVLHTGPRSRAALLIDPETLVRLDQASTLSIRQSADETIVEFTRDPGLFQRIITAPNPCGAGYFISRFPRKFRVLTPFVNASVEGTEFLVAMRCESALVAVFEGRVRADDVLAATSFSLKEGESVEAGVGQPAAVKLVVKPVDAVQWALYYPPLTEAAPEAADQKCDQADNAARSVCIVQRAEERLRSGRVEEAEADVQSLLSLGLGDGDAYALLSIIQVVKNEKAAALDLANRATQLSSNSARAWLALSYAHQAAFDLEKALAAARKATELAPDSSTAQARVAELLMSVGRIRDAEKAATAAVAANPNDSRAHMVLGFVRLAQINTKAAREDFLNAIERDSTDPLARLGLGLAIIRDGDLKAGREQIEIAVALDPTNSLIRSYVGKAYYEENTQERDQLAATLFEIAKQLDPSDPTPWFYEAILKQARNLPVEALESLQQSIELNDNRAVYRSKLLLDEDRSARSASTAQMYSTLGFNERAMVDVSKALSEDFTSYTSHAWLSDLYGLLPRQQAARETELLQSQIRAPIVHVPVMPIRSRDSLVGLIPKAGYAAGLTGVSVTPNEYSQLFERRGGRAYFDALLGDYSTFADRISASGVIDGIAIAAGQGHYENGDGLFPGREIRQDAYEALLTVQMNETVWLHASGYHSRVDRSDVASSFDPDDAFPVETHEEYSRGRIGLRARPTPGAEVLVYVGHEAIGSDFSLPSFDFGDRFEKDATTAEVQFSFTNDILWTTLGAAHADASTVFGVGTDPINSTHDNAYIYGALRLIPGFLRVELGLSHDRADDREEAFLRTEYNPKVGLVVTPLPGLAFRAASVQTVKREIGAETTLEPTQVAGFNQFYDDPVGAVAETRTIAMDARVSRTAFAGAEFVERDIDAPFLFTNGFTDFRWSESWTKVYTYFGIPKGKVSAHVGLAFTAEYWRVILRRPDDLTDLNDVKYLRTIRIPLGVRAFTGPFRFALTTSYFDQSAVLLATAGNTEVSLQEEFWSTDVAVAIELPRRYGYVEFGVANLFDERAVYQEIDPSLPQFSPKRLAFVRAALRF